MIPADPLPQTRASLHDWLAVLSVAAGTFIMVTTEFLPVGLLTSIGHDLHVSEGVAGFMVTVPGLVAAVAAPAITVFSGTTDRRTLIFVLTGLIMFSNVLGFLAPNFWMMLGGRVLLGLCVGGFWTFAAAVGRRLVPEGAGNRATALILAAVSVGTVLGVPAGAFVGLRYGWRISFLGAAILSAVILLWQILVLPRLPARHRVSFAALLGVINIPLVRIGFMLAGLFFAAHFAAYTYLEPFLTQVAGFSPADIGFLFAGYGLAGLFGTFVGERLLGWNLRGGVAAVAFLLATSLLLLSVFGEDRLMVATLLMLWGFSFGSVPLSGQIWLYQAAPEKFETVSAWMVCVSQIGLAAGAFAGGLVVDHLFLAASYGLAGVLATCAGLIALFAGLRSSFGAAPATAGS
jgi:predicted MFS family arabinose efflux permease